MIMIKKYIKIIFHRDDDLPLRETLETYNVVICISSVFNGNNKYYLSVFSKNIETVSYKFVLIIVDIIIWILYYDRIDVSGCIYDCHDLMQRPMDFNEVSTFLQKKNDSKIYFLIRVKMKI